MILPKAGPSQSGEIDLVARLNIAKVPDYLIIKNWESDLPDWKMPLLPYPEKEAVLAVDKPVSLRHGWWLEAKLIHDVPVDRINKAKEMDPDEAWLDYDRVEMPLLVRGRMPGDRWQPLGLVDQTQKLKDFFINEKIPEHLRDVWPLVCSGEEVAWVVGVRPSEIFKITGGTKRILRLKLIRKVA